MGSICYSTELVATVVAMCQVVPSFYKDGNLNLPQYNGRDWVYGQQTVKMSFPYCKYGEYAEFGAYAGKTIAGAAEIIFVIIVLLKAIKTI